MSIALLCASLLAQLAAAWFAVRLIRTTGRRSAWILIAAAIGLMALRRAITLFRVVGGGAEFGLDVQAEVVALSISILLAVGLSLVGPYLRSARVSHEILAASEQRFRQLTENIREVFWLVDLDGKGLLYVSPAFETVFGRPVEEVYRDPDIWLDLIVADDRDRVQGAFQRALSTGVFDESFRIERPDGLRRIRARGFQVKDAKGHPMRIAGTSEDVTERLKLEEQLRQSQKMEVLGRLAGGVAHDFNNVLTAILGQAELLEKAVADDERVDRHAVGQGMQQIVEATRRGATLTRQLLSFSRRQTGVPEVLDPNRVIAGAEHMIRRLIREDIELSIFKGEDLWTIRADAGQLEQILMNLVINARDAMPQGGAIRIETANVVLTEAYAADHSQANAGRHVVLAVTDTGTGMDEEVLGQIFEPFFTTKPRGEGTGLGLSTVYGLVQQAGGHVEVGSNVGKGSSFRLYFPAAADQAAPAGDRSVGRRTPRVDGTTVLMCEDDDQVRTLSGQVLESAGCEVLCARSGEHALALARRHEGAIDVLVTDLVLPDIDGRRLGERLREMRPQVRVLYVSGYTEELGGASGEAPSPAEMLAKPFGASELLTRVRGLLESDPVRVGTTGSGSGPAPGQVEACEGGAPV